MKLIETYNGVKINVELTHPDFNPDFKIYVVEDIDNEEYTENIIKIKNIVCQKSVICTAYSMRETVKDLHRLNVK